MSTLPIPCSEPYTSLTTAILCAHCKPLPIFIIVTCVAGLVSVTCVLTCMYALLIHICVYVMFSLCVYLSLSHALEVENCWALIVSRLHLAHAYLFACNCYEVGMQWDVHLRDTACGWEPSPPYWCQSLYIFPFNIYLCLSRVFVKCDCVWCVCMQHADSKCYERYYYPSARMRSEGYGSCLVCVCVSVCPGLSSATHTTTRPSRHTYGLSIVLAPEFNLAIFV